jgi:hypothetical protein
MKKQDTITAERKRCIKKFLYYFPGGYEGEKYIAWEREYKWNAHIAWNENLYKKEFQALLDAKEYDEIARRAIWLESRTNLLFSFEKMAIRDAVKMGNGAEVFSKGLFEYVYGKKPIEKRFEAFTETLRQLPRKQTRVLTWPLQTVFGFIANPKEHIFLKPMVTKRAAEKYGFDFKYKSQPNWETYKSLLDFAKQVEVDTKSLKPKDMIDLQSFIWVMGSEEYPD